MTLAAKLDDLGGPAWIALTVVSFLIWWPLGLVALGYLVGSGRMARWTGCGARRWQQQGQPSPGGWWGMRSSSSGNRAFDEYRTETLRRLEEEQREFKEFLGSRLPDVQRVLLITRERAHGDVLPVDANSDA